jgi:NADPH-dependent 2,4-dienoyl-CoA reductase/sulfur reductase-like enzyme
MLRLLIIGGSDAGISAALRAREVNPELSVTLVCADDFPNYSICGIPFYLSGEVADWRQLAHRSAAEIENQGVTLLTHHRAQHIDTTHQQVTVVDTRTGQSHRLDYDRLIIATGGVSTTPPIPGADLPGVFFLRWMNDSLAIHQFLLEHQPRSVVLIGGGYIGMEMADALCYRGLAVTLMETAETVLKTVDLSLGQVVQQTLQRHSVTVITNTSVTAIEREATGLALIGSDGSCHQTDMVLVAVGARPMTELAEAAGINTGVGGAIRVTRAMETNIPTVYAAGDCVETWHRLLNQPSYLPLGSTAHKQGRIAGENAAGGQREFAGSLGTQAVKIFDCVVARTGLRDSEAIEFGFQPMTVEIETWDHKVYYPGAHKLRIRITGDRHDQRLLGAQILGHRNTEVAKRIDVFATALFNHARVEDLNDLDLSYTPPLSSPWDPIQMSAQAWCKAVYPLNDHTSV